MKRFPGHKRSSFSHVTDCARGLITMPDNYGSFCTVISVTPNSVTLLRVRDCSEITFFAGE